MRLLWVALFWVSLGCGAFAAPPHGGSLKPGSLNLGMNGIAYYSGAFPFLNIMKMAGNVQTLNRQANVTITQGSPGVVTYAAHGFVVGTVVQFATTGSLPTGLSTGTNYYVTNDGNLTTNTFAVSTSLANAQAGTAINTSSGGAGTQSANASFSTQYASSTPNAAWQYLDANGDLANPAPSDIQYLDNIFYAAPPNPFVAVTGQNPMGSGTQTWILTWNGSGTCGVQNVGSSATSPFTFTFTTPMTHGNQSVLCTSINTSNPPVQFGLFSSATNQTLYNAGQLWDPSYVQMVRAAGGMYRFMQGQSTNNNTDTLSVSQMPSDSYFLWGAAYPAQAGLPVDAMVQMANNATVNPWINIPMNLGAKNSSHISSISNSNPAVVTTNQRHTFQAGDQAVVWCSFFPSYMSITTTVTLDSSGAGGTNVVTWTGHGFQANQMVSFSGGTLPTGLSSGPLYYVVGSTITTNTFQVSAYPDGPAKTTTGSSSGTVTGFQSVIAGKFTVASPTSTTFQLSGYDTTAYSSWPSSSVCYASSPFSVSAAQTEVANLVNLVQPNLKAGLFSVYQWSNETWNAQFAVQHWAFVMACWSGVQAIAAGSDKTSCQGYRMNGYVEAAYMDGIRKAYGAPNRSQWKGLVDTQTINNTTVGALLFQGVNDYLTANSLTITQILDYLTFDTYIGSIFSTPGSSTTATFNIGASTVTANGLANGVQGYFYTTGQLPGGLTETQSGFNYPSAQLYTATSCASTTCSLETSPSGGAVTMSGSASGTAAFVALTARVATFNTGAGTVTQTGGTLVTGTPVIVDTTGTLPAPLTNTTIYYTIGCTANACQLATTSGGSAIALSGGSGSAQITSTVQQVVLRSLMNQSATLWVQGSQPTKYAYWNVTANQDLATGQFTNPLFSVSSAYNNIWTLQQNLASSNSLGCVAYEGGSQNGLIGPSAQSTDAQTLEFFPYMFNTAEAAANTGTAITDYNLTGCTYFNNWDISFLTVAGGDTSTEYWVGAGGPVWDVVTVANRH